MSTASFAFASVFVCPAERLAVVRFFGTFLFWFFLCSLMKLSLKLKLKSREREKEEGAACLPLLPDCQMPESLILKKEKKAVEISSHSETNSLKLAADVEFSLLSFAGWSSFWGQ